MSNRRFKRTLVNGARVKAMQDVDRLMTEIAFALTPKRDEDIRKQRDKEKAAQLFADWQHKFINTPKPPEQVTEELIGLANQIETELNDKELAKRIVENMIWPAIARSHNLSKIVQERTCRVTGQCVCGLIHNVEVPLRAWMDRSFDLECEKCGYKLPASECAYVKKSKKGQP